MKKIVLLSDLEMAIRYKQDFVYQKNNLPFVRMLNFKLIDILAMIESGELFTDTNSGM